ncbi:Uncharacterised protein [Mycobacteroides abscessus subsp. abscessus]|nr:Uncharacterised protein [Mycobacteroides abscessus subsp. abscessus]
MLQHIQMAVRHLLDPVTKAFDRAGSERSGDQTAQPSVIGWIGDQDGRRLGGVEQLRIAPRGQPLNDR